MNPCEQEWLTGPEGHLGPILGTYGGIVHYSARECEGVVYFYVVFTARIYLVRSGKQIGWSGTRWL